MEKNTYSNHLYIPKWTEHFQLFSTGRKKLLISSILLCFSILLFSGSIFGQAAIGKPGTSGDFEIDGNFIKNNSALKDWRDVLKKGTFPFVVPGVSDVAGENAKWIVDGNSGTANNEKEVFRGSSNKNGNFIGEGQSPYTIETSSPSTPQKNDITNVYARATMFNGRRLIMLAAETRSVDGTSYLDFEYNQAGIKIDPTGMFLIGNGPNGGRTVGDLLFVVDFSKGGNAPIPKIFRWEATGRTKPTHDWKDLGDLTNNPNVFIVTNGIDVDPAGNGTAFAGDGTPSNTTLALQLVEIGVDLTGLNITPDDPCKPGATLTCKTRTSSSYTSELKDFSLFQFSLVPPAEMTPPEAQIKCESTAEAAQSASFSTTVSGAGADANNVKWYKGASATPLVSGVKYTIAVSGNTSKLTINNVALSDADTYRAELTGATCGAQPVSAKLSVNETAKLIDLTAQTKCESTAEAAQSASFSTSASGTGALGSNIEWYFGTTKLSNGTKYTILVEGDKSTLTINNVGKDDDGTYTAKLVKATCGAPEKSSKLTVNTTAALTNLEDQTKCPGEVETAKFSTTVSGTAADANNVQWFKGSSTTPLATGDGSKYTITVDATTNTSTLTIKKLVEADEDTYTAKLTKATCGSPSKSGKLTINPLPKADAGATPAAQCYKAAGNVFALDGSNSVNGDPEWIRISPEPLPVGVTVDIVDAKTFKPTVTVKGATAGVIVTLRLTVTSNTEPKCGSDAAEIKITVKAQAAGKDGDILPITCTDKGFKLKLQSPDAGTKYTVTQPCNPAYNSSITAESGKDVIFENLKFAAGYKIVAEIDGCEAAPVVCGGNDCSDICATELATVASTVQTVETINARIITKDKPRVSAAPNPFSTRLRFQLQSDISGRGTLELYNMMGQRVQVVFQGNVEAGKSQTIEYSVPSSQRTNLIYLFRVGEQTTSGKLIGMKE